MRKAKMKTNIWIIDKWRNSSTTNAKKIVLLLRQKTVKWFLSKSKNVWWLKVWVEIKWRYFVCCNELLMTSIVNWRFFVSKTFVLYNQLKTFLIEKRRCWSWRKNVDERVLLRTIARLQQLLNLIDDLLMKIDDIVKLSYDAQQIFKHRKTMLLSCYESYLVMIMSK